MALYDPVNGVYRKVSNKYDPVDGVYRKVKAAYDPVDGVYRKYLSSGGVGSLAVGDSVWLNVDGTLTEFLVVHQGNPDSALYDESCNGTWLLWKNEYVTTDFGFQDNRDLTYWLIYSLQDMFADAFDSNVEAAIKQAKIPYYDPNSGEITNGVMDSATKFFLLSGYEVGFTTANSPYLPVDGACLDYFSGATNAADIWSYYIWALRSAVTNSAYNIWAIKYDGTLKSYSTEGKYYGGTTFAIRPAFILDSNTPIDNSTGINIIA